VIIPCSLAHGGVGSPDYHTVRSSLDLPRRCMDGIAIEEVDCEFCDGIVDQFVSIIMGLSLAGRSEVGRLNSVACHDYLQLPIGTVKSRIAREISQLRKFLLPDHSGAFKNPQEAYSYRILESSEIQGNWRTR